MTENEAIDEARVQAQTRGIRHCVKLTKLGCRVEVYNSKNRAGVLWIVLENGDLRQPKTHKASGWAT